nr:hypothetical protein A2Y55_06340 [uncultured bacterium]
MGEIASTAGASRRGSWPTPTSTVAESPNTAAETRTPSGRSRPDAYRRNAAIVSACEPRAPE